MKPGQLPDRPPRRRERPRWPKLLLIAGVTLTVVGFVLTVGPLAPELGGTGSPPFDEPASEPSEAGASESDGSSDTGVSSDEATAAEDDDHEGTGIRGMIGETTSKDETREECVVE
ncbi:hypothetical protein [Halalkalicoccus sp. NIPERK01]|uniref:hypothetical protein n=1 Tax=Halalkalicoccus sp. NIPERK01 TaxID=3053469 RepID=UPI00256EE7A5|nr:hypothetical protein [Halalkalicoccus sp. NIPERK01]MDL5360515.1 hypothetical protein [Halalkalicoccus sp. NIPERK01]